MNIAAFSKYLAYDVGGAEKSTIQLLKERVEQHGDLVSLLSVDSPRFLGSKPRLTTIPEGWSVNFIPLRYNLNRFSSLEYVLNRKHIRRIFENLDVDELWVYGSLAPAAILGFSGAAKYFIRSESDLGVFGNYHNGVLCVAKEVYRFMELPSLAIYRRDLRRALERSTIIANSKYMASRAYELYGITSEVIYPKVDVSLLKRSLEADTSERRWVVFVGDSAVKGLPYVLRLAKLLPGVNFRIISRFVATPRLEGNVLWAPWESELWRIYSGARLVIVPSQWEEAYGRVAREAYLLGIPVLVSAVGGLPEAVNYEDHCQVNDYRNLVAWKTAIEVVLSAVRS